MAHASLQASRGQTCCPQGGSIQSVLIKPKSLYPTHAPATCSRADMSAAHGRSASCLHGRIRSVVALSAAQEPTTSPRAEPAINVPEVVRGCRTVLAELKGLDFPRSEVQLYFASAIKLPRGHNVRGATMERASAALQQLLKVDEEGDPLPASQFKDPEALALVQAVLSELWRWRRRGGGMNTEDTNRTHQAALQEIQNIQPVEDIDRMSSSLLDNLPNISDQDKADMSSGMQSMALGAFQGAVWGSMIFGALAFVAFNFLRAG